MLSSTLCSFPRSRLWEPESESLGDLAGSQPQQAEVAGALEQFMDGEVTLEDEVPAVFYLLNRVMTIQRDGLPLFLGKLGPDRQSPVVQPLFDDRGAQTVGSRL